ncbi:MAG: hypothetical protein UU21_C0010G0004 [Candidatus Levybacteria bacterium GW2011_GWA2_40_8]|nr:MAG: hypothetical protein UU21_C0010G0004 [Candidatus Levybacteria bacterium GW2011_GWA2_40_8]
MKDKESLPWDKKKIALLLLFLLGLLLLFITAKSIFLDKSSEDSSSSKTVRGTRIEDPVVDSFGSSENIRPAVDLEEKIGDIKSEIENIDVSEIASSSPQIQKIIQDIKSIKDYPASTARQTCENICKNL